MASLNPQGSADGRASETSDSADAARIEELEFLLQEAATAGHCLSEKIQVLERENHELKIENARLWKMLQTDEPQKLTELETESGSEGEAPEPVTNVVQRSLRGSASPSRPGPMLSPRPSRSLLPRASLRLIGGESNPRVWGGEEFNAAIDTLKEENYNLFASLQQNTDYINKLQKENQLLRQQQEDVDQEIQHCAPGRKAPAKLQGGEQDDQRSPTSPPNKTLGKTLLLRMAAEASKAEADKVSKDVLRAKVSNLQEKFAASRTENKKLGEEIRCYQSEAAEYKGSFLHAETCTELAVEAKVVAKAQLAMLKEEMFNLAVEKMTSLENSLASDLMINDSTEALRDSHDEHIEMLTARFADEKALFSASADLKLNNLRDAMKSVEEAYAKELEEEIALANAVTKELTSSRAELTEAGARQPRVDAQDSSRLHALEAEVEEEGARSRVFQRRLVEAEAAVEELARTRSEFSHTEELEFEALRFANASEGHVADELHQEQREKHELTEQISNLKQELDAKDRKLLQAETELHAARERMAAERSIQESSDMHCLAEQLSNLKQELDAKDRKLLQAETELHAAHERMAVERSVQESSDMHCLAEELSNLKQDLDAKDCKLLHMETELRAVHEHMREAQALQRIQGLKASHEEEQERLGQPRELDGQFISEANDRIASLEASLEADRRRCQQLHSVGEQFKEMAASAAKTHERELREAIAEQTRQRAKLCAMGEENLELGKRIAKLTALLDEEKARKGEVDGRHKAVEGQLQDAVAAANAANEKLVAACADLSAKDAQIADVMRHVAGLETDLADAKERGTSFDGLHDVVHMRLRGQLHEATSSIREAYEIPLQEASAQLQISIEKLSQAQAEVQAKDANIIELNGVIVGLEADFESEQARRLKLECAYTAESHTKSAQLADAKGELEAKQQYATRADMRIATLEAELAEEKTRRAQLEFSRESLGLELVQEKSHIAQFELHTLSHNLKGRSGEDAERQLLNRAQAMADNEVAKFKSTLQSKEREALDAKKRIAALEAELAEQTRARDVEARETCKRVVGLGADLSEQVRARKRDVHEAALLVGKLEAELAELTLARQREAHEASARVARLEADLAKQAQAQSREAADVCERRDKKEDAASVRKAFEARLHDAVAMSTEVKEELSTALGQLRAKDTELSEAKQRALSAQAALEKERARNDLNEKRLCEAAAMTEASEKRLREAAVMTKAAQDELAKAKAEKRALEARAAAAKALVHSLEAEVLKGAERKAQLEVKNEMLGQSLKSYFHESMHVACEKQIHDVAARPEMPKIKPRHSARDPMRAKVVSWEHESSMKESVSKADDRITSLEAVLAWTINRQIIAGGPK